METPLPLPERFLAERRFALVGVSRDPKDFSRGLLRELLRRGYDVVPVSPHLPRIDDRTCFASVQDIQPPVTAALLLTPPSATAVVAGDCITAGVRMVWMHRGAGVGAVSREAASLCRDHGVEVVEGACPYMYLPRAGAVHRLHGFFHRMFSPAA
jgi:predicted CoA-binding protein